MYLNEGTTADDLIGDTPAAPVAAAPAKAKAKAKKKAAAPKPKPAAKKAAPVKAKAKKAAAKKPAAKKAASKKVAGGKKGSGKFYFPKGDGTERAKLASKIARITRPATTKEVAEKLGTETWKVRLACTDLLADKRIKSMKQTGSVLTINPK